MDESPASRPKTSLKCSIKLLTDWVTVLDWVQMVSAHWSARPVSREMMKAILALSVGQRCGCIYRANEHWRRNPLHSSATSLKGAGLAMGLAITDGEEDVGLVMFLVEGTVVGVRRTRRRLSTSSSNDSSCCIPWFGSDLLLEKQTQTGGSNTTGEFYLKLPKNIITSDSVYCK